MVLMVLAMMTAMGVAAVMMPVVPAFVAAEAEAAAEFEADDVPARAVPAVVVPAVGIAVGGVFVAALDGARRACADVFDLQP